MSSPKALAYSRNGTYLGSAVQALGIQRTVPCALETTIKVHEATIEAHKATIADLQRRTATLTAEREEQRAANRALEATIEARDATIRARDDTIRELLNSTSWKATQPLRVVSRTFRRSRRILRQSLRGALGSVNGPTSRAVQSLRLALAGPVAVAASSKPALWIEPPLPVTRLIRESKQQHSSVLLPRRETLAQNRRLKISVIAWDLAHNPLGRAYLIADVLRNDYDVEIVGASFPKFGDDIWKPLRDCSRVAIKSVPGQHFPEHFSTMANFAERIEGDVLLVSKPRLPSLELAILAKIGKNRPIVLDIDDHELSFVQNRLPLSLEELKVRSAALDVDVPYGTAWTRYSESLIPYVDRITVSNEELRKKYGGLVLPHIRDEHDFNPALYPRDAIRRELGFAPEDKVVLFAGTPRMHKGLSQLLAALRELDQPTYKLLVVGSPSDRTVGNLLRRVDPGRVTLVSHVAFCDLPGYLCAADLVTLLQDEGAPASAFQMPAKFTDALAMGVPVLASNVSPLLNLRNDGLIELLGHVSPAQKIDEIFSDYPTRKERAKQNRRIFLERYSYGANLKELRGLIEGCAGRPSAVPDAFRDLVEYHRSVCSLPAKRHERNIRNQFPGNQTSPVVPGTVTSACRRSARVRRRANRSYVDDKLDIVFFWKQNDTGIYGRRQDMFVKYLAQDPRVHRILHFDAPVDAVRCVGLATGAASAGGASHARLVARQTLKRRLGLANGGKVRFDTFVHVADSRAPGALKHLIPSEEDYLDFLSRIFKRHEIGQRCTILWVCPASFDFPKIEERFDSDLLIADVIDDERQWHMSDAYRGRLSRNYHDVLARSDIVLTNCQSVLESMRPLSHNIHLVPNAVELLEEESKLWPRPRELRRFTGPIIGYVGNLDIARLDLDLLRGLVRERSDWNFVFIGSMHRGDEIRELERYGNVHFLGVRVYERALRYIRHFDVAIIPHLDNRLTKSMNPLKLYVYHALLVPVVSTPIANIGDFGKFVRVARTSQEFVQEIDACLRDNPIHSDLPGLRMLLKEHSWPERVKHVLALIECELAKAPEPLSLVSPVNHTGNQAVTPAHAQSEDTWGRLVATGG